MRTRAILLSAFLALAAACGKNTAPAGADEAEQVTQLRVENHNFLDADIFVFRNGQRTRLGTATGNANTTFTIPARLLFGITALQFEADPVGGRATPVSEEVSVSPGDVVVLIIPAG